MADISAITLPSGSTYNIKDAWSREKIGEISASIKGGVHYIGKTTTALSGDGDTTLSVVIGGVTVEAKQGDMVSMEKTGSQDLEFLFNGTAWYELGSTGSLKALAFADSATGSTTYTPAGTFSANLADGAVAADGTFTPEGDVDLTSTSTQLTASYTPAGTVTQPTFTNGAASVTATYTPAGTVTTNETTSLTAAISTGEGTANYTPAGQVTGTFQGASMNSTGTFTPAGSVSLTNSDLTATVAAAESGDATYTPAGTVAAPTISVASAGSTTTIKNPTAETVVTDMAVAEPNSTTATGELVYCSMSEQTETLSFKKFVETTGDSISTSDVTVKTGDASYEATAPAFTGTGARLVTGNISVPSSASFSGTEGNVSVTGTTTGSLSGLGFNGTGVHLVNSGIEVPSTFTFGGTEATINSTGTATGTVSQPTFSGTAATITTEAFDLPTGATFAGTSGTVNVSGTATGSVSGNITGTQATITITSTPTT